jgi:DNA-binding transcriptional LysR family regulator
MNYHPQLLDGLQIFVEVVKAGSFTEAADNTGHSTSYISKEITKLEERLGVRLMNRTTRSLNLTPEGEVYVQQCQQLISDAIQAQNLLMGQQLEPSGTLRVSCPASFGIVQMQDLFADFLRSYPKVRLDLDLSNRKVDMIGEGFDVIVRATPKLEDSSLISRRVMTSRAVTFAAPAYLQQYGTPLHPEELAHDRPNPHQCITYSYLKQPRLWDFVNQYGKPTTVEVSSRISSNSSEMELSLCRQGMGIARMPAFMLTGELERGELVELFSDFRPMAIDIYLIYPSRKHMSSKVRAFIDFVADRLGEAEAA